MDRGDLVPDEVIIGVILERVDGAEARRRLHPRRLPAHRSPQAEALDDAARASSAARSPPSLLIDVPDDEVVAPARGPPHLRQERATSTTSSSTRPKHEGVCDIDGSRADRSATTTSPR